MSKEKSYHHGDLKSALIEAGLAILERDGLKGLGLRAIAAKAGVSHTAPRNHFGSLRGLLTAIGAEGYRRHAAFMREGLSDASTGPDRLQAAMEGYVRFSAAHPALFKLMFSDYYCDFEDAELQEAAAGSYAVLTEVATGLDWDKAAAPDAQHRAEMMLWSFAHGFATLSASGQFGPGAEGANIPTISDVLPTFRYRDR
ncbi:TetR/AcrR family transcriptional regulator [Roseisalinus antarcticus]|uniref:Bacterial regulatory proteins, tetR family n=1 Tax=Roseisalinus antarcticus TaxID=254357 RepID=A0A1Y5TTX4_9RHOB|nr:TetR/AcrR family transcriptional regulator [Roseisalinus antarcticus]SLN72503.1 Bacterial regulatory proteins, tetR family [Roseisalinus antarcticus]